MNKRNSLKRVLLINFILISAFPVLIISLINLFVFNHNIEQEITNRNKLIATSTANHVEGFLNEAFQTLNEIKEMESKGLTLDQWKAYLEIENSHLKYFESIQKIDETGKINSIVPANNELLEINQSGQDFFAITQKNQAPYWSATFISLQTGQPTITITVPLNKGMIAGYLNLSKLNEITRGIKIGKQSFVAIIDQKGTYITHPEMKNVFQREKDEGFIAFHGNLKDGETYQFEHNGIDMLASVAVVKLTNWPVIIYQSQNEAFTPARNVRIITIIGTIITLIISIIISLLNIKKILTPFQKLMQGTEEVAAGNYEWFSNHYFNNYIYKSSFHEFYELSKHFNIMTEKVRTREEELNLNKQELQYICYHDAMTGLYNRAFFEVEMLKLESIIAKNIGIVVIDLDGLKVVNDTLGHSIGDKLLLDTAKILIENVRDSDVVARIGGDEFVLLLPNCTLGVIETVCQRINKGISLYNENNHHYPLSLSFGTAIRGEALITMDELYRDADQNMYRAKLHKRESFHSSTIQTLAMALEARDFITEGHSERIESLLEALGETIGMQKSNILDLRLFARFHDIGKVGIPDRILFKPETLTSDEWVEMRRHSEIGYRIAKSSIELKPIADLILKHHENWDGKGYPLGLKGEEIPIECRMLAIVDAYDVMTNDRPYWQAITHKLAILELKRCSGTQFDPMLVPVFIRIIKNRGAGC